MNLFIILFSIVAINAGVPKEMLTHYPTWLEQRIDNARAKINQIPKTADKFIPHDRANEHHDQWRALDKIILAAMQCPQIPGATIIAVKNGKVLYKNSFGYRNLEPLEKVDDHTLFNIGSTTKAFTSTALAMQEEEALFSWTTQIRDYVPKFRFDQDKYIETQLVPVDCLSHRVGLARSDTALFVNESTETESDLLRMIRHIPLQYEFRTSFVYNNYMYSLAGYFGADVEQTTWRELIQRRILNPLGMTSTITTFDISNVPNVAYPYTVNAAGEVAPYSDVNINEILNVIAPAGAISSNNIDMAKWLAFLTSGGYTQTGRSLISTEQLSYTWLPKNALPESDIDSLRFSTYLGYPVDYEITSYGLGWIRGTYRGNTLLWHDGGSVGFSALVAFIPDANVSVFWAVNSDAGFPAGYGIMFAALDILLGHKPWLNATTICTFPCPWASQCNPSTPRERKHDTKQTTPSGLSATPLIPEQPIQCPTNLTEYVNIYVHPSFGNITVTVTSGGDLNISYGILQCVSTACENGDFFYVTCTAPFIVDSDYFLYFFRRYLGDVESVCYYEFDVYDACFTRIDSTNRKTPEYPLFLPTIPEAGTY